MTEIWYSAIGKIEFV